MSFEEQAARYADSMMRKEPPLLAELREATKHELEHDDMLSGPVVGAFLHMLVRVSGARSVLEIGTFTGYATLWMAMALPPAGRVVTCEVNEKYARIARRFFDRYHKGHMGSGDAAGLATASNTAAFGGKGPYLRTGGTAEIRLMMGPALETGLPDSFDFAFLDADKEHYPEYYEMIMPRLAPGGILVIDNAFWGGLAWGGDAETDSGDKQKLHLPSDRKAIAIDRLNRTIADDPNVENVVLTVRDGLHLVRKIR